MPPARQRTFNRADGAKRPTLRGAAATAARNNSSKTVPSSDPVSASRANVIVPGVDAAFKAFLSARICAALWSHITDCDETFNYWEPLHYLLFGSGLQTWEYSPEFALRSYTYLLLHGAPAWVYQRVFAASPVLVFYFVRFLLGVTCAIVEVYFYKSVCREFGVQIGRLWLLFQLFSPGLFIASVALLPSSFAMYACSAALAAWWNRQHRLAIFFVAIAALLGWPFAALVGVPIAGDLLLRRGKWRTFLLWSLISAFTVALPMLLIDSTYFGRLAVAPLNIILYNVFGSHGPNLYGTEPWTFYALNGMLNFNILWPLALATPTLLLVAHFLVPARSPATLTLPHYISLAPFYLWLVVFAVQPHKEERFLFPVYFMVGLCAAISVDTLQRLWFRMLGAIRGAAQQAGSHYLDRTVWMAAAVMVVTTVLGVARIAALYQYYHAPLDVWTELHALAAERTQAASTAAGGGRATNETLISNVCAGKDWYRLPGSFLLPDTAYRVRFVRSEFRGHLPAYFAAGADGTSVVTGYFNAANVENGTVYVGVEECEFMFDLDVGRYTELEPDYAGRVGEWRVLQSAPFLDAERSHWAARAFYVPGVGEEWVRYGSMNLLQRVPKDRKKAGKMAAAAVAG